MVRRIYLYANAEKADAQSAMGSLVQAARDAGLYVVSSGEEADFIVVVGGDGTMLSAAHAYPQVPLLGLNFGGLGYLSAVEAEDFSKALCALGAGEFELSRRTALETEFNATVCRALNDIVVSRGVSGHSAAMDLSVAGREAAHFSADGLVIATPTGSTAYSLAAGGPVVLPDSRAFVISPVCPHALASRPLVVPDAAVLAVSNVTRDRAPLAIHADGETIGTLACGETLTIRKSALDVPLVQLPGYDPYAVLARKLGWNFRF